MMTIWGVIFEPLLMVCRELQSLLSAYITHCMSANYAYDLLVLDFFRLVDIDELPFLWARSSRCRDSCNSIGSTGRWHYTRSNLGSHVYESQQTKLQRFRNIKLAAKRTGSSRRLEQRLSRRRHLSAAMLVEWNLLQVYGKSARMPVSYAG